MSAGVVPSCIQAKDNDLRFLNGLLLQSTGMDHRSRSLSSGTECRPSKTIRAGMGDGSLVSAPSGRLWARHNSFSSGALLDSRSGIKLASPHGDPETNQNRPQWLIWSRRSGASCLTTYGEGSRSSRILTHNGAALERCSHILSFPAGVLSFMTSMLQSRGVSSAV